MRAKWKGIRTCLMTVIILFRQTTAEERDELIKSDCWRIILCHSNHIHFRIYFLGELYQFDGNKGKDDSSWERWSGHKYNNSIYCSSSPHVASIAFIYNDQRQQRIHQSTSSVRQEAPRLTTSLNGVKLKVWSIDLKSILWVSLLQSVSSHQSIE